MISRWKGGADKDGGDWWEGWIRMVVTGGRGDLGGSHHNCLLCHADVP